MTNFTNGAAEYAALMDPEPAVEEADESLVGRVFSTSWGYDQTNVEFFEVVRETKSSVWLRRLSAEVRDGRVWPAEGEGRFTVDPHLYSWNDEVWDEKTKGWVPNPQKARDLARGYSEKVCRKSRGYRGAYWFRIDDVRGASEYTGDGEYETFAAGGMGH